MKQASYVPQGDQHPSEQVEMTDLPRVTIHTDGSAQPTNPGPGGYGVVIKIGGHRDELSGGFDFSTNNRMELMAAIVGLEALEAPSEVMLCSDSEYVVNAIQKGWLATWRTNSWRNSSGPVKNLDLWKRFIEAYDRHDVTMVWVPGHAGNGENECCDALARAAARQPDRPVDAGCTSTPASGKPNTRTGRSRTRRKGGAAPSWRVAKAAKNWY